MPRPIAMLTDFGLREPWVMAVKNAIIDVNPQAHITDISHDVAPHDVFMGSFLLWASLQDIDEQSVVMAIVDPGVGSQRKPIVVVTENRVFVGPDNGIFSFIFASQTIRKIFHITADHYFRSPVSQTFHARDVFAPVVGYLSKDISPDNLGDPLARPAALKVPKEVVEEKTVHGAICHFDRFGNAMTNIRKSTLKTLYRTAGSRQANVKIQGVANPIPVVSGGGYGQSAESPVAIINGFNLLEIAMGRKSALKTLSLRRLTPVQVVGA